MKDGPVSRRWCGGMCPIGRRAVSRCKTSRNAAVGGGTRSTPPADRWRRLGEKNKTTRTVLGGTRLDDAAKLCHSWM